VSKGETKTAVVAMIQRMPDDLATSLLMLYMLRCFNDPTIIVADIQDLDDKEVQAKADRKKQAEIKSKIWQLLGLIAVGLLSTLGGILIK